MTSAPLVFVTDSARKSVENASQEQLAFLGIESSPAFVRAPEGSGCAERLIRTPKEQLLWLRPFRNVEELRLALLEWAARYHSSWLIERNGFLTPIQPLRDRGEGSVNAINPASRQPRAQQD